MRTTRNAESDYVRICIRRRKPNKHTEPNLTRSLERFPTVTFLRGARYRQTRIDQKQRADLLRLNASRRAKPIYRNATRYWNPPSSFVRLNAGRIFERVYGDLSSLYPGVRYDVHAANRWGNRFFFSPNRRIYRQCKRTRIHYARTPGYLDAVGNNNVMIYVLC